MQIRKEVTCHGFRGFGTKSGWLQNVLCSEVMREPFRILKEILCICISFQKGGTRQCLFFLLLSQISGQWQREGQWSSRWWLFDHGQDFLAAPQWTGRTQRDSFLFTFEKVCVSQGSLKKKNRWGVCVCV